MNIKETYFIKNWLFIVDKIKQIKRLNKGEILAEMGYNSSTDFQWKKRGTISSSTLKKICLYVNRELGWEIQTEDLLNRNLEQSASRINEADETYLPVDERRLIEIFRHASNSEKQQIIDFAQYLSKRKK